jgi:GNAT superfamily N-acetyltransferase
VRLRAAATTDQAFLVEMARFAATLDDRPLPEPDDPAVAALLPATPDAAIVATDDQGAHLGAAWWLIHEPPLLCDAGGGALPELGMGVTEAVRGRGIGTALVEALAALAAERFDALTLNVHLLNPAVRLYIRTGFRVAGQGRGWYGVAMRRSLP